MKNLKVLQELRQAENDRDYPHTHGKRTDNQGVAESWAKGDPARSGNMSTDGDKIFSYWLQVGATDSKGKKHLADHTSRGLGSYSNTTGKHISHIRGWADVIHSNKKDFYKVKI